MREILCITGDQSNRGRNFFFRGVSAPEIGQRGTSMANSLAAELKGKTGSATEAASRVRSGDWIDYGFGACQPDLFDRALAERIAELSDVKLRACLSLRPRAVVEADPEACHLSYLSWYLSAVDRRLGDRGLCHHIPMNFGETPEYYRRFLKVDVAVLKTTPMDEHGFFNFGLSVTYHRAVAERAKIVVVETDASMPYVYGMHNGVHLSEVDLEIEDGACIQIGIGAMPNAVCQLLARSPVKDLGVHTEMFVDALLDLYLAGKVTGARKQTHPNQMTYCFAAGTARLYRFLDRNPACFAGPVDYTNLPRHIMRNDRAVSICNAAQVDLSGQVCSESAGIRQISGTGGQLQFVRGAYASAGGKAFLCLSSTYERAGRRLSRIVARIDDSNVVTVPRTDVMYVVTEYGCVNLKGKSVPERARALIGIAHPDFREELERKAREYRLIGPAVF
jgi:acyl-CoA hydrolase